MKMPVDISGSGEPLVLVPGGLTGWIGWVPHAERLSSSRKVIRVQLLNVQAGLEDHPLPSDYSVKTESRALAAALDGFDLPAQLDLAAWSYGALVTLDYALDNPTRVRTLTLIEPPAFWVLRALGPLDAEAEKEAGVLRTLHGDISEDQLEQFLYTAGLAPPGQNVRGLPQWPVWSRHRLSLRNSPAVLEHEDNVERLQAFNRPVLLVKGTGSAKFLHQIVAALAKYLPHAQVAEWPAGHAPHIISMDLFLARLASFQSSQAV